MSTAVAHLDTLLRLGREAGALTFFQISLRGVVVFVAALVIVRCGAALPPGCWRWLLAC
jgi:hypothetical protein